MDYILVLGASSDIAKATINKFASKGYGIYLAGRNLKQLELDAKNIEIRYEVKTKALVFDVLMSEKHLEFYNSIDCKPIGVICFCGYLGDQKLAEQDFDEAQKIINTNYVGCVSILNVVASDFAKRQSGWIVGVSSVAGDRGRKSNYIYGSAKGAFSLYLSGIRNRLAKEGVHVLTVKPGFVATKMTEGLGLPEKLTAQPEEVAIDIYNAVVRKQNVLYTKWFWFFLMLIIRNIPEPIFKKMNL